MTVKHETLMTMKMTLKMKNRSHRYNINRPRLRHEHKYTKYKMCLSIMTFETKYSRMDQVKFVEDSL